jgi:L-amino acid N-acyltransferase YncA
VIRSAVIADAHSITALWNDLIRETAVTFTTELKVCSDVEAMIMDPGRSVFICEQEGVFEGFALFGAFRGGPGYAHTVEHSIYLVQGKGLGRALMDARKNAVWHDLILMHLILETPTDTSERKG